MAAPRTATAVTRPRPDAAPEPLSAIHLATELLGGAGVLKQEVRSDEDAHALVLDGIPAAALPRLLDALAALPLAAVLAAIGVSERTLARRKAAPRVRLPVDESERLWRFAEILGHATRVFGSQAAAEDWLGRPAIALDRHTPIDLLRTHPGARLVADHLTRIEYGVYT